MLLERDGELDAIERLLADVERAKGRVLALEGPAGIGKTALLRELEERAAARGVETLRARASQLDQGFSFGVARQLLERRVESASAAERRAVLRGAAADAMRVLGAVGDDAALAGDGAMRSMHGLYWLAANLAGRGPLVLSVDDAHWADRASLRWLLYTTSRLAELPLAIVVGTRREEPGAEQDLLDELLGDDSTTVASLGTLSAGAVGAVVDASLARSLEPEFAAACHRSTGGNPFLLHELLRELSAEGASPTAARAAEIENYGVAALVRDVRRRLGRLGPEAVEVARAVAVIGDGAAVAEVAELCGRGQGVVRSTATDLAAAEILVADPRLGFVHPLVRAAVYEEMPAVQRARLHRRVATLRAGTDAAEQVAVHLLRVDPQAGADVVEVLRTAAAEASARGAPEAAVTFLRRALAEPPSAGDARSNVLVELGEAEALARMDGFDEHLSRAIEELADPERAAEVALSLAHARSALGDGVGAFDAVAAALPAIDANGRIGVHLEAQLLTLARAYPQLRPRAADRVDDRLRRIERGDQMDPVVLGAMSAWLLERPPAARALEAVDAALADERLPANAFVLLVTGYTLLGAGQLARAGEVIDSVLAEAGRRGERLIVGLASAVRSETSLRLGEVDAAEEMARFAWAQAVGEGMAKESEPLPLATAAAMLVNTLVVRGELDEAQRCIGALPASLPARAELFLAARAELRLARGEVDEAIADLRRVGELLGDEFQKPVQNWRARLAVALAGAGERQEGRALARAELEQARRWEAPLAIGVALTAAGVVEGRDGGVALLEEAVTVLEGSEGRLDHAVALIELGALLRRTGSRAAAREPLRGGMDLAARCGATAYADRAHAELVAAGARPRRDRRFLSGPESLTPSEMRVARLAADGLTDRAIAQRLYVTQAAVQFHLRNCFRKLGIRARRDLAAALASPAGSAKT